MTELPTVLLTAAVRHPPKNVMEAAGIEDTRKVRKTLIETRSCRVPCQNSSRLRPVSFQAVPGRPTDWSTLTATRRQQLSCLSCGSGGVTITIEHGHWCRREKTSCLKVKSI